MRKEMTAIFDNVLSKLNMTEHRNALLVDARECVHLHYGKITDALPPDTSRIGGMPQLPRSVQWPDSLNKDESGEQPKFLAYINLKVLPALDDLILPRHGHLWIFVEENYQHCSVIYRDGNQAVSIDELQHERPLTNDSRVLPHAAPFHCSVGISLPFSSKSFRHMCRLRSIDHDKLDALREQLGNAESYGHSHNEASDGQIGGYSFQAEYDLCREIAIKELGGGDAIFSDAFDGVAAIRSAIERGLPFPGASKEGQEAYRSKLRRMLPHVEWIEGNQAEIDSIAMSIQLLCMFRPSLDIGLDFGDGMYLDFLMHRKHIVDLDFSKVQCRLPMLL